MTTTAIVPTYQESHTAPRVIEKLQANGIDETIVVDDSPTMETARAVRRSKPEALVIHREGDGLGSAVIRGFAAAAGDTYLVVDGDGQHPPPAAARIADRVVDGHDLVVGTRHADGGDVADEWPLQRQIISRGADLLARGVVPPARGLSDPMSGLFAVDAAVVDPALPRLRPSGYKIILEILARCRIDSVAEVGYQFRTTDSGSNLGAREYVRYLRHLLRLAVPSRQAGIAREQIMIDQEAAEQ